MATTRNCSTALTFHQVRAHLANAAHQTFTESELVLRLRAAGVAGQLPTTRRGLSMRYAWILLPSKKGEKGDV